MEAYTNPLRKKLSAGETALGFWISLEAPSITEIATTLGLDWVLIDAEHGHLDFREIAEHIRALRNSSTAALVRIAEIQAGLIKRVLDLGADGIMVPQVNTAEEAALAVRLAKYPPQGIRGLGGERATRWGLAKSSYTSTANRETMVIPMMETPESAEHIEAIAAVPGVDAVYFVPGDFSSFSGHLGAWEGPGVAEALLAVKEKLLARHVPCGIAGADLKDARRRMEQGFQMISVGSDTGAIIAAMKDGLSAFGRGA
jgi:2-keto-3-deoxy-L-rhamnonate aldolase RhmA